MSDTGTQLAEELFQQAADLPPTEREAFLRERCGGDAALQREVVELLNFLDGSETFLEVPPASAVRGVTPVGAPSRIPERIGNYRVVRLIGEGGMGTVFEAEQDSPRRRVALKLMRPGWISSNMLRRFHREAQVLGQLQHPGIAHIYEAGSAEFGFGEQPYFAMEFVDGVALTAYASDKKLNVRQRLTLVAEVCDAVQHAHDRGVIHRDLKPANILVDATSGTGRPKVLDFGVARAADADVQTLTLQTDVGQLIGTLAYMSPEQASGDPAQIDARSDAYALGVILYELLAGRLPLQIRGKSVAEASRMIRDEEPSRLSSIDTSLRGDIETITTKAMEKDKSRRYESVAALAADIRRYLGDEPITARPASGWYQLAKFTKRNRALVGGVAAAFVALLAGLIASLMLARAESRQRTLAEQRLSDLTDVTEFQLRMLSGIKPVQAGNELFDDISAKYDAALQKDGLSEVERRAKVDELRSMLAQVNSRDTAVAMIDRMVLTPATHTADTKFKNQPVIDGTIRQTLADIYRELGEYDKALPLQQRALEARRASAGVENPTTLVSMNNLGAIYCTIGRFDKAERYWTETLELRRRVLGPDHSQTLQSMHNMALLREAQGRNPEAEAYFREAIDRCRNTLGENDPRMISLLDNLGANLCAQERPAEAEPFIREALQRRRTVLGEDDSDTIASLNNLGGLLWQQEKYAEAEPILRQALEGMRRTMGEDHPDTIGAITNMGAVMHSQGRSAEAESYFRDALEKARRIMGDDHPDTLNAISNMGAMLREQGRLAESEPFTVEALERYRRLLGPRNPNIVIVTVNLAELREAQGDFAAAESLWREIVEIRTQAFGADHPNTLRSHRSMVEMMIKQRKFTEAESLLLSGNERASHVLPAGHDERASMAAALAALYDAWHQAEPDKGHDAQAKTWRDKQTFAPSASQP